MPKQCVMLFLDSYEVLKVFVVYPNLN